MGASIALPRVGQGVNSNLPGLQSMLSSFRGAPGGGNKIAKFAETCSSADIDISLHLHGFSSMYLAVRCSFRAMSTVRHKML